MSDELRQAGPDEVADRLAAVRRRIADAARAADRDPAEVRVVAVSKFQPLAMILAARDAGQIVFGESRAQELDAKLAESPPDLRWDFVGRLQRNKVHLVAGRVGRIHSVDRALLADAIAGHLAQVGGRQDVLIQVNVTGERRKGGCRPDEAPALAAHIARLGDVDAVGLMTIPPLDADPGPIFSGLRALRARLAVDFPGIVELSMGMSGDLEAAVAAGATIVRVGTAIFGARPQGQ